MAFRTSLENGQDVEMKKTTTSASVPSQAMGTMLAITDLPPSLRSLDEDERNRMEKRLVRKLDMRLMIPLILMYIMNYLDRNAIAAAKVAGIEESLSLSDHQFQLCVSILFIGYILMQVPSALFLNKIGRPALYLPGCMIVWGALCAASGATHNFVGLLLTRFWLGFIEAAYFPGCMVCLTAWYTRKELALRTSLLYCGSLVAGAFSGLIGAGIVRGMEGTLGLEAWRWLFIIEGAMTVAIAIGAAFVLPDFPINTRWLSSQEKDLATWRLLADIGEEDWVSSEQQTIFLGLSQCARDYKSWILVALVFGAVSSGTISSYFPTVVGTLGYGEVQTLLLTAPPYLLSCIVSIVVSWNADRTGERYLHFTLPLWTSVAGFIISASVTNLAARYFSMMIMLPGVYTAFTIGLVWAANTLPRPPAKRAAVLALCNACGNCSSIYGPFLYPGSTAPRYLIAMCINAGTALLSILTATVLRFILKTLNKRMDEGDISREEAGEERTNREVFRFLY